MKRESDDAYKLHGNLTMHGVTTPVSLNVEFGGITKDGYGNTRAGFTVDGIVNRKDFDLNYNMPIETGGLVLSEDVKVLASVQFIKS